MRHKVSIEAHSRDVYERIFSAVTKRVGMAHCPEVVDFLYERYYDRGRSPRASDCRDLLEIVQAICRFRRQPVQLTRDLMVEAARRRPPQQEAAHVVLPQVERNLVTLRRTGPGHQA